MVSPSVGIFTSHLPSIVVGTFLVIAPLTTQAVVVVVVGGGGAAAVAGIGFGLFLVGLS